MLYQIQQSGYADQLRNGVVLTGGGASLVNIGQMLKEMSGYTVRTGYPRTQIFSSGGCPGAAEASAAASIGMILEASRDSHLNCIEEAEAATDAESASAPAQAATEETTAPDNGTFFNDDELREITAPTTKKKEERKPKEKNTNVIWTKLRRKISGGLENAFDSTVGNLFDSME